MSIEGIFLKSENEENIIEKNKTPEGLYEKVFKELEDVFKIKKEQLETEIEGFKDLSKGQQVLVIENLKQLTLGQIKAVAVDRYNEKVSEKISKYNDSNEDLNFLAKVWKAIKKSSVSAWQSVSKKYQIAKEERKTAEEILGGGINNHREKLIQLVNGMKTTGPEAVINEKGELEVWYTGRFEDLDLTEEEQEVVSRFNQVAKKFVNTPPEWSLPNISLFQKRKFKEVEKELESVFEKLIPIIEMKNSGDEKATLLEIADIKRRIYFDQLFTSSPEIEKSLKAVSSRKEILRRAIFNVVSERGFYMAAGFITRAVTISIIGAIGAPLAAGFMSSFIAQRRAREALKEKETFARRGVKEESVEVLNIKKQLEEAKERYRKAEEPEEKEKALKLVSFLTAELIKEQEKEKPFVDAESLNNKLQMLLEKLEKEKDPKKAEAILASLKARIDYTEEKIKKGLVNFGKIEEQLTKKYKLLESLTQANLKVNLETEELAEKLAERLKLFLKAREQKVEAFEKKFVTKKALYGFALGAGLAIVGYSLRQFVYENFIKAKETSVAGVKPKLKEQPGAGGNNKEYINTTKTGNNDSTEVSTGNNDSTEVSTGNNDSTEVSSDDSTYYQSPELLAAQDFLEKLATVKKGEGVWHAVYRQLEDQLKSDPAKFKLKEEDLNNHSKIRSVLIKETNDILVKNNIIKPDGTETRILEPGAKVILKTDGEIEIIGKTYEWKKTLATTEAPVTEKPTAEISNIEDFKKLMETYGISQDNYEAAISKPGVTVGDILDLSNTKGLDDKWEGFAQLIKSLNPKKEDLKLTVDDFLKERFSINFLGENIGKVLLEIQESITEINQNVVNFKSFSILDQEKIINSSSVKDIDYYISQLNKASVYEDQNKIIQSAKEMLANLYNTYQKNLELFNQAVGSKTGLVDKDLERFLQTGVKNINSEFKNNEKVLAFIKAIKLSDAEIEKNLSMDEILKSRFVNGNFQGLLEETQKNIPTFKISESSKE